MKTSIESISLGRRLTLAIVLLMSIAALSMGRTATAAGGYDNAAIADRALSYWNGVNGPGSTPGARACADAHKPGDTSGQCRSWVNCIVWMVSGHTQNLGGSDYFAPFLAAGGTEITDSSQLAKGDIVQIGRGIHTTIIVKRNGDGTYMVVDSNHASDERVWYYPRRVTLSSNQRAFRMGTVRYPTPVQAPAPQAPAPAPPQVAPQPTANPAPPAVVIMSGNVPQSAPTHTAPIQPQTHPAPPQPVQAPSQPRPTQAPAQAPPNQSPPQAGPSQAPAPADPRTYPETTGGVVHTWTNYANAGGTEGPTIGSNVTVQISCRVQGFRVADGDDWWYKIASPGWDNNFYSSADPYYNNGQTSGSLHGTPFYDPAVPIC